MSIFDIAVIGNGMIGSAASRYLSAIGLRVLAIGPGEPTDWPTHQGVFASHYDQGRITRIIDPDPVWAELAVRSIAVYPEIAAASGIDFHHPAGCLRLSPDPTATGDTLDQAAGVGQRFGASYQRLDQAALASRFPPLHFPAGSVGLWEAGAAGFINPRALVQAQLMIAERQGATTVRETVVALERTNDCFTLRTVNGQTFTAAKVLLSAGSYTAQLSPRPLTLAPRAVSIVIATLAPAEATRLHGLPSLIWRLADHPVLASIYATPPTPYPDGALGLKIGGTLKRPRYLQRAEEFSPWFQSAGNPVETDALRAVLLDLLPGLRVERWQTKPCLYAITAHDRPYIDQLDDGLFVAAGDCGAAAKSSNEIGRLAAQLVATGSWRDPLDAQMFRAIVRDA